MKKALVYCFLITTSLAFAEQDHESDKPELRHRPRAEPLRVSDAIARQERALARAQPIDCGNERALWQAREQGVLDAARQLPPLELAEQNRLQRRANELFPLLGARSWFEREDAQRELSAMGPKLFQLTLPHLDATSPDAEVRRRYAQVILRAGATLAPELINPRLVVSQFLQRYFPLHEAAAALWRDMSAVTEQIRMLTRIEQLREFLKNRDRTDPAFAPQVQELARLESLVRPRDGVAGLRSPLELVSQALANGLVYPPALNFGPDHVNFVIKRVTLPALVRAWVLAGQPGIANHRNVLICVTRGESWQLGMELEPAVTGVINATSYAVDGDVQAERN